MARSGALNFLRALIFYALVCTAFQNCFVMKLLTAKSTETKFYRLHVQINNNNTVSSVTRVLQTVPMPMWYFTILQTGERYKNIHYNGMLKACELDKFIKRVRFFSGMALTFFNSDKGNMTLKCPMPVGTYVMTNLFIPLESKFMRFLYVPNTIITLRGGVGVLNSNNKLEKLSWYEFNGTIYRMC